MMLGGAIGVLLWARAMAPADVSQISSPAARADSTAAEQLSPPSRRVDPAPPSPKLSPLEQVNGDRPSAAAPAGPPAVASGPFTQVNPGGRTAEPPAGPPPAPRRVVLDPVTGEDRCDPRKPTATEAICTDRLETRAASFAPPPTPEQRLLATATVTQTDPAAAARELGQGGDLESQAAQAVAFRSLQGVQAARKDELPAQTRQAVDAAAAALGLSGAAAVVIPQR